MQHSTGIGPLLRRYRLAAGLTQEELAERAGLSVHSVSDLERGLQRKPYRETIRRLENATGAPLPLSLRAFWEIVGGVNFAWNYEEKSGPPNPALRICSSISPI